MRKWTIGVLLSVVLLDGITSAEEPKKQSAFLVESHYLPKCAGLDCPPWHTAPDIDFCFQVGDAFYTGESRPWGVPWASSAEGLCRPESFTAYSDNLQAWTRNASENKSAKMQRKLCACIHGFKKPIWIGQRVQRNYASGNRAAVSSARSLLRPYCLAELAAVGCGSPK
jgi:hypothetical protein